MTEFEYRMKIKSSLAGVAQIYSKYNTSSYDKLRLDLVCIENDLLLLDIKLMIFTVRIMFSKESTEDIDVAEQNQAIIEEIAPNKKRKG